MNPKSFFLATLLSLAAVANSFGAKPADYIGRAALGSTPRGMVRNIPGDRAAAIPVTSSAGASELTAVATDHCEVAAYTIPATNSPQLIFNLYRHGGGASPKQRIKWVSDRAFKGWIKGNGPLDATIYFYCELSRKPSHRAIIGSDGKVASTAAEYEGSDVNVACTFSTHASEPVIVKTAISHTSIPGAMNNFRSELPASITIEQLEADNADLWNAHLGKIMVEGGSEADREQFYTALFQAMLEPRIATDADGQYRGADNRDHTARGYTRRDLHCSPDQAASLYPLLTIIDPSVARDAMNTIIDIARENRTENFCAGSFLMPGSSATEGSASIALITDCVMKGLFPRNLTRAYAYAVNTADSCLADLPADQAANIRWCLLQLAKTVGDSEAAALYSDNNSTPSLCQSPAPSSPAGKVLSAIGLQPASFGKPEYQISIPHFDKITINLDPDYFSAKTFTIKVIRENPSDSEIKELLLNGKPLKSKSLTHKALSLGGTLEIILH